MDLAICPARRTPTSDAGSRPAAEHVPISGAASTTWHWNDQDSVSLGFTRSERAPQAAELYSDGVHHATHSYERGTPGLRKETGHNLELGLKTERSWYRARLDLYHNWVSDYIYGHYTGELFDHALADFNPACAGDCAPVLEYRQRAATFKGYEAQVVFPLGDYAGGGVDLTLFSDYVR
ncbi:TonB-dependent receptor, partial [Methylogaea oryzae]|uniref:TonB-dependent receptor n=1 Tax=Methylogaea oryzae TaxID=1295382 RepID=UPI00138EF1E8